MENMINMDKVFGGAYKGKKVFVTGHTGFKGSWLSAWLLSLGADVTGYSLYVPSTPSHFELIGLESKIKHVTGDIRDLDKLSEAINGCKPDIVFHLAAQAITRKSYDNPHETFITNLGGTVNVLECIRNTPAVKAGVIITSDKCYENVEWIWGYRENDKLGGVDPYSASKACAEIAAHSYFRSFFKGEGMPKVATARAGNVIGGGDWAADRIVPDCVRAFSSNRELAIRNSRSTRPWQHVLEPLSGYLLLGSRLLKGEAGISCESFNFGPSGDVNRTVEELIRQMQAVWGGGKWSKADVGGGDGKKEATLLKLNCDKAGLRLNWKALLDFNETVEMTASWYKKYYSGDKNMFECTKQQISDYMILAAERRLSWVL